MGKLTVESKTKKPSEVSKMIREQKKDGAYDGAQKIGRSQVNPQLELLDQKLNQIKELQNTLGNDSMANLLLQDSMSPQEDLMAGTGEMESLPQDRSMDEQAPQEQEALVRQLTQATDEELAELREEKSSAQMQGQSQQPQGQSASSAQEQNDQMQLAQANAGQSTLQNESFVPAPQKKKKRGWFKNKLHDLGHYLYKGVTALTTPAGWLLGKAVRLFGSRKATQETYDTRLIPGSRDKEHFAEYDTKNTDINQEIENDVRRVPLVWEQRIPEDPNQPSKISLMMEQPKEGSGASVADGKIGHAMVALFYTRPDRRSGKNERYRVKYGFYPKGGFAGVTSTYSQLMQGLTVPGQMLNDSEHEYSVSQTFEVTNDKINRVLAMSEDYAESGYSYFKRNCTTFVKDAAQTAGVDAGNIFEETDVNFDNGWEMNLLMAGGLVGGGALVNTGIHEGALNHMQNKSETDDISYAGFGQKMVTQKDLDQADKNFSVSARMWGLAPGIAGENMRSGKNAQISSIGYMPQIKMDEKISPQDKMKKYLDAESENLVKALKKQKVSDELVSAIQEEMARRNENVYGYYEDALKDPASSGPCNIYINDYLKYLNDLYINKMNSTPKLNISFQHMAAVLQYYQEEMYTQYNKSEKETDESLDVSDTLKNFDKKIALKVQSEETSNEENENIEISIAEQAALIQMFGSLQEGGKFLREIYELQNKEKKTTADKSKLALLNRKERTLKDFVAAQNSYVNRKNFTQGDMNLAFLHLQQGEKGVIRNRENNLYLSAGAYQALAYEKVFGGLKSAFEEYKTEQKDAGLADEEIQKRSEDWLTEYVAEHIESNWETMQMIVNAICQTMPKDDAQRVAFEILDSISTVYLRRVIGRYIPFITFLAESGKGLEGHPVGRIVAMLRAMVLNYRANANEGIPA